MLMSVPENSSVLNCGTNQFPQFHRPILRSVRSAFWNSSALFIFSLRLRFSVSFLLFISGLYFIHYFS